MNGGRLVKIGIYGVAGLALFLFLLVWALLATQWGTRVLLNQVQARVVGLEFEYVKGTAISGVEANNVRFRTSKLLLASPSMAVKVDLIELMAARLAVQTVYLSELDINYQAGPKVEEVSTRETFIGFGIKIDRARADVIRFVLNDNAPLEFSEVSLGAMIAGDEVDLNLIEFVHQGLRIQGNTRLGINSPFPYEGDFTVAGQVAANGRFKGDSNLLSVDGMVGVPDQIGFEGSFAFDTRAIEVTASADQFDLSAWVGREAMLDAVTFDVNGTLDSYIFSGEAGLESGTLPRLQVTTDGSGSLESIVINGLSATGDPGHLAVAGSYRIGERSATGEIDGELYGRGVTGSFDLNRIGFDDIDGIGELVVGANRSTLKVRDSGNIGVTVDWPDLAAFDPMLSGVFSGTGTVGLSPFQYEVSGRGASVAIQENRFDGLQVEINSEPGGVRAVLATDLLTTSGTAMGSGTVSFVGQPAAGELTLDWRHPAAVVQLSALVGLSAGELTGRITNSQIETMDQTWQLGSETSLRAAADGLSVDPHCWLMSESSLCFEQIGFENGIASIVARAPLLELEAAVVKAAKFSATLEAGVAVATLSAESVTLAAATFNTADFELTGKASDWKLDGGAQVDTALFQNKALALALEGNDSEITVTEARLELPDGVVMARGRYVPEEALFESTFEGKVLGRQVTGQAEFLGLSMDALAGKAHVALGGNRLDLNADGAGKIDLALEAPDLSAIAANLGGELSMAGLVSLSDNRYEMNFLSETLRISDHSLVDIEAKLAGVEKGDINADVRIGHWQFDRYDIDMGGGGVSFSGKLTAGVLKADWKSSKVELGIESELGLKESLLSGRLLSGKVATASHTFTPSSTVDFVVGADRVEIQNHCWVAGTAELCASADSLGEGIGEALIAINRVSIDLDEIPLAPDLSVKGVLDANFHAKVDLSGETPALEASGMFSMPATSFRYVDEEPIPVDFNGDLSVTSNQLIANVSLRSDGENYFTSRVEMPDVLDYEKLIAEVVLVTDELGAIAVFLPQVDRAQGSIDAKLDINAVVSPAVANLAVHVADDASVVIPAAGIVLTDLRFDAESQGGDINIALSGSSGGGTLSANGVVKSPLTQERSLDFTIKGEAFQFLNREDVTVVTSPDLRVRYGADGVLFATGSLVVTDGEYRSVDLDVDVRRVSPDVVIVSAEAPAATVTPMNLQLDVRVEKFRVNLYGLDGGVAGAVTLTQTPGFPRRAVGNLNLVGGKFDRFGQSFDVERGRLIFNGPLENPLVDVVSTRTIDKGDDDIKVSLILSGPADNISSRVTSVPAMSEARALSYLIIGRSLDTVGESDGNALSSAALALGLRQAAPITEEIRSTLGLSELTVVSGADSTSVIAGKRISSELYVEYNYDVFSRLGGIMFSYELTPKISLRARSGESSSMQLVFTF